MSLLRSELQESARKAFGNDAPNGDAAACWTKLSDMGWFMICAPEASGGLGMGLEALGVIHGELGRVLAPGGAIAQMLVVEALAQADAAAGVGALLERAMAGEIMTTTLCHGIDADQASHVLLVEPGRIALAPTDTIMPRTSWDSTRRLFDVAPADAAITLAQGGAAAALGDRLRAMLLVALAADSLGAADAVLAITIDYLKVRRQFDRPLALFQALKHRLADLKVGLATAEALFWSRCHDGESLPRLGALKAHVATCALRVAEEAIQLHGGIGLTAEHPCHLFLKRILLNRAWGGDPDLWEEVAGRALLNAPA